MNFSCNYLSTAFKKETGETLQTYIRIYKLNLSKRLLRVEGTTIPRVAEKLGYKNPDSYIFAFKKEFDQTPGQFIKNIKRQ